MIVLRALAAALGLLTRLPVGRLGDDVRARRASLAFYPLVGLALGALSATAGVATLPHVGALASGVFVVATLAFATGGLHLDGVADVVDGLSGARGDRDRALAIMRDPHVGAHGVVALVLVLAAKIALTAELIGSHGARAVLLAPLVGRAAVVPLIVIFPTARPEGLANGLRARGAWAALSFSTASALGAVWWARPSALTAFGAAVLVALGLGAWLARKLGGLTGDCYGAAVETTEIVFLALAAALGP